MNRNIIVTGGSGGIGSELVRRFASDGDYVFFSYLNGEAAAKKLMENLPSGMVSCARMDLRDRDSIDAFVSASDRFFIGKERYLINNAGAAGSGVLTSMSDDDAMDIISADLTGAILLTKRVLPGMIFSDAGGIVNISSVWGERGASCESVYSAAKAGLIGFTKAVARELAGTSVRVNAVAAGFIDTPMTEMYGEDDREEFLEHLIIKRTGTVRDVADAVEYLLSDASSYVTGQVLRVDGGYDI